MNRLEQAQTNACADGYVIASLVVDTGPTGSTDESDIAAHDEPLHEALRVHVDGAPLEAAASVHRRARLDEHAILVDLPQVAGTARHEWHQVPPGAERPKRDERAAFDRHLRQR